jgi:protease PrsW
MVFLAILFGLLPGVAWLFFYLKEDEHPEPKRLIALTFVFGMVSAFAALIAEQILNGTLDKSVRDLTAPLVNLQVGYLFALALIEETVKFGAAYFAVHKSASFDEPIDAMIYMVAAALGFATIENLGAAGDSVSSGQTALLASLLTTTSLRFVGATLLHSLTSGVVGYHWANGIRKLRPAKYILAGLIVATLLHALFNYLVISYGNLIYIVVFLVTIGFFVLNDFEKLKLRQV